MIVFPDGWEEIILMDCTGWCVSHPLACHQAFTSLPSVRGGRRNALPTTSSVATTTVTGMEVVSSSSSSSSSNGDNVVI